MFNMNNPKYNEGQKVFCKPINEFVYIKRVGKTMYFCVSDPGYKLGFYYSEEDLEEK